VNGTQTSTFQVVVFDFTRKTVTVKTIRGGGASVQLRIRPL
jgi:hypothetical protein